LGVILDTSVLIEVERGKIDIEKFIAGRESELFSLSIISVAELLHGVHRADSELRKQKRAAYVDKIIDIFPIYPFDLKITKVYEKLWSDLLKKGINIGAHDLMIGATAISLGFSIATFNVRHFSKIDGLKMEVLK
jgi:tRNA(fMet)-specific endonuclease VapC